MSGIGFYLILAYFCTVYRLTVTFEQLSKYSNIYRAGRAGREGTHATGTGQAPASPNSLRCQLRARCTEVQVWRCRCGGAAVKVQAWRYRYRGTGVEVQVVLREFPSRGDTSHCRTDRLCHPAQCLHCLLEVRLLLLQSRGLQQCWRDEDDEVGEQSKAPGRVGGCWVSQEGLQASTQAQTEQQDQRWWGGRMNVKEPLVYDHGEVPNQTMGHCMEICTRKSCRRSTEHLGFSAYRGVWFIRQDHAIPSLLHNFSLGKTKCRFHCINSNGCIT